MLEAIAGREGLVTPIEAAELEAQRHHDANAALAEVQDMLRVWDEYSALPPGPPDPEAAGFLEFAAVPEFAEVGSSMEEVDADVTPEIPAAGEQPAADCLEAAATKAEPGMQKVPQTTTAGVKPATEAEPADMATPTAAAELPVPLLPPLALGGQHVPSAPEPRSPIGPPTTYGPDRPLPPPKRKVHQSRIEDAKRWRQEHAAEAGNAQQRADEFIQAHLPRGKTWEEMKDVMCEEYFCWEFNPGYVRPKFHTWGRLLEARLVTIGLPAPLDAA